MIPAVIVPVHLLRPEHRRALRRHAAPRPGLSFKAFELPVAVIFAVTGVSRASSLVPDIQNGYFDRLTITPVRRLPLLLGLMMADLALVMALAVPVILVGLALGVRFATGVPGMVLFVVLSGLLGPRLHRAPLLDRPQDREPLGGERQLHPLLPLHLPQHHLRPAARPRGVAAGHRPLQPDDLHPRRPALAHRGAGRAARSAGGTGALGDAVLAIVGFGCFSITLAVLALRGRVRRR